MPVAGVVLGVVLVAVVLYLFYPLPSRPRRLDPRVHVTAAARRADQVFAEAHEKLDTLDREKRGLGPDPLGGTWTRW